MNARYMVTSECHRGCEYCISKNVKVAPDNDITRIANLMRYVSKTHDSLELTGGEPTLDPKLTLKLLIAKEYFRTVSVRTAQPMHLSPLECKVFDHINVSAHNLDDFIDKRPVDVLQFRDGHTKMHMSINDHQYYAGLPKRLARHGWDGLSIWEDVWNPKPKSDLAPHTAPEGFSVRHLSSDECLDQIIILPDLDIITGQEYDLRFLQQPEIKHTNYPVPMPRLVAGM